MDINIDLIGIAAPGYEPLHGNMRDLLGEPTEGYRVIIKSSEGSFVADGEKGSEAYDSKVRDNLALVAAMKILDSYGVSLSSNEQVFAEALLGDSKSLLAIDTRRNIARLAVPNGTHWFSRDGRENDLEASLGYLYNKKTTRAQVVAVVGPDYESRNDQMRQLLEDSNGYRVIVNGTYVDEEADARPHSLVVAESLASDKVLPVVFDFGVRLSKMEVEHVRALLGNRDGMLTLDAQKRYVGFSTNDSSARPIATSGSKTLESALADLCQTFCPEETD